MARQTVNQKYEFKITWLRRYRECLAEEEWLMEEIAAARARGEAVTRALQPVAVESGGQHSGQVSRAVELMDQYQRELELQVQRSLKIRLEMEEAISKVEDSRLQQLLRMRYIGGYHWDQCAQKLHLDLRWCFCLHEKALAAFACPTGETAPGKICAIA